MDYSVTKEALNWRPMRDSLGRIVSDLDAIPRNWGPDSTDWWNATKSWFKGRGGMPSARNIRKSLSEDVASAGTKIKGMGAAAMPNMRQAGNWLSDLADNLWGVGRANRKYNKELMRYAKNQDKAILEEAMNRLKNKALTGRVGEEMPKEIDPDIIRLGLGGAALKGGLIGGGLGLASGSLLGRRGGGRDAENAYLRGQLQGMNRFAAVKESSFAVKKAEKAKPNAFSPISAHGRTTDDDITRNTPGSTSKRDPVRNPIKEMAREMLSGYGANKQDAINLFNKKLAPISILPNAKHAETAQDRLNMINALPQGQDINQLAQNSMNVVPGVNRMAVSTRPAAQNIMFGENQPPTVGSMLAARVSPEPRT